MQTVLTVPVLDVVLLDGSKGFYDKVSNNPHLRDEVRNQGLIAMADGTCVCVLFFIYIPSFSNEHKSTFSKEHKSSFSNEQASRSFAA
jgi:hypothetical protein